MRFGLGYDVNRIASIDVEVRVLWDAMHTRMALRFANADRENGRWVAIADNVLVCVNDEQALVEIRFANVQIVSGEPS
jgi:hypothetical protein